MSNKRSAVISLKLMYIRLTVLYQKYSLGKRLFDS